MRVLSPLTLIFVLCFCCLSAVAQDLAAVRVGVAVMGPGAHTVPGTQARDELVKILDRGKTDTKLQLRLEPVALEGSLTPNTIAEARDKGCGFVLYTKLEHMASKYSMDHFPTYYATVDYQLSRAIDGSQLALGSIDAEDSSSSRGAIWQALSKVAKKAALEIKKSQEMPDRPPVAGMPAAPSTSAGIAMLNTPQYCTWLPSDIAHADALRGACEYAINFPVKMPNFICGEDITRYRGKSSAPVDLISASVRFEDGHESYSDEKINGRPLSREALQDQGLRSTGEFGSNLRSIFNLLNHALFKYSSKGKVGGHAAWIFTYKIVAQKEPVWVLRASNQIIAPPYSGELWVDEKDGTVVRFRTVAKDMPLTFPMKYVDMEIDYEKIEFGDGTNFVLPVNSTLINIYTGEETSKNVEQFRDCHKFGAKARILANADIATPGADSAAQVPSTLVSVQKDLAENEAIFAALGEQAFQENAARLKAEQEQMQQQMLDASTAAALARLSALRSTNRGPSDHR